MPRLWTPLLLLLCLAAAPALGQSGVVHPQKQGQEVQIGAGTTAETTTGSSGAGGASEPSADEQGDGGTQQAQDQPPDPATVCDDLQDQAIRRQCIEKAER